ncbi:hypothetical protein BDR26DRAFT_1004528 [Obelidium mucronatum]|nr:hypothetical protein BDR26DRAFT_1004528 [Obelidium mucronatum]
MNANNDGIQTIQDQIRNSTSLQKDGGRVVLTVEERIKLQTLLDQATSNDQAASNRHAQSATAVENINTTSSNKGKEPIVIAQRMAPAKLREKPLASAYTIYRKWAGQHVQEHNRKQLALDPNYKPSNFQQWEQDNIKKFGKSFYHVVEDRRLDEHVELWNFFVAEKEKMNNSDRLVEMTDEEVAKEEREIKTDVIELLKLLDRRLDEHVELWNFFVAEKEKMNNSDRLVEMTDEEVAKEEREIKTDVIELLKLLDRRLDEHVELWNFFVAEKEKMNNSDRLVEMTDEEVAKEEREIKTDVIELLKLLGHTESSSVGKFTKAVSRDMLKVPETRVPVLVAFEQARESKRQQTQSQAISAKNPMDVISQRVLVNAMLLERLNTALQTHGITHRATKFPLSKLMTPKGYYGLLMEGFPIPVDHYKKMTLKECAMLQRLKSSINFKLKPIAAYAGGGDGAAPAEGGDASSDIGIGYEEIEEEEDKRNENSDETGVVFVDSECLPMAAEQLCSTHPELCSEEAAKTNALATKRKDHEREGLQGESEKGESNGGGMLDELKLKRKRTLTAVSGMERRKRGRGPPIYR